MSDITASPRPRSHRKRRSSSDLTNTPLCREWSEACTQLLLLERPHVSLGPSTLLPPVAAIKMAPSSLETLLWIYHFHSSMEVRRCQ